MRCRGRWWRPVDRRLSLWARHSFKTERRRGLGGSRCNLQLSWEASPARPSWCCVCPQGEKGQCVNWKDWFTYLRKILGSEPPSWDMLSIWMEAPSLRTNSSPHFRLWSGWGLVAPRASSAFCESPVGLCQGGVRRLHPSSLRRTTMACSTLPWKGPRIRRQLSSMIS